MPCKLCKAGGSNVSTCPNNPYSKNPQPDKHDVSYDDLAQEGQYEGQYGGQRGKSSRGRGTEPKLPKGQKRALSPFDTPRNLDEAVLRFKNSMLYRTLTQDMRATIRRKLKKNKDFDFWAYVDKHGTGL